MDEGLPSSPPRTSLTTADVLLGGMFKVYNSFIVLDVLGGGGLKVYNSFIVLDVLGGVLKVYNSFIILDDVLFITLPFCAIETFVVASMLT